MDRVAAQAQAQQAAEKLSDSELIAVSLLCAIGLVGAFAFIAYAIFGSKLKDISDTGIFTIVGQITFSIIVIYVVALLMLKKTIDADAGLPILAGLAGVIVGKARGGGGGGGGGNAGGGNGGGGGGGAQEEAFRVPRAPSRPAGDSARLD
jgi:uncharacterized membrane protein YgcG